jgi:glycosyltransferase involved in cell wall biosynthesis
MHQSTDTTEHPLLTFILIAYNQEQYITQAVEGALSQNYTPLEIIISDDCSQDHTFEIMQEVVQAYRGPHQVIVRKNERNLGMIGHINRVMELAQGEFIVCAAGDDISFPHRTETLWQAYLASDRKAKSIFSNAILIDGMGNEKGLLKRSPKQLRLNKEYIAARYNIFAGATQAWDRSVFDIFGPLPNMEAFEDVVIPFRSSLLGEVLFITDALIKYRTLYQPLSRKATFWQSKSYRLKMAAKLPGRLTICQSRINDLGKYSLTFPEHKADLTTTKRLVLYLLDVTQFEKKFIEENIKFKICTISDCLRTLPIRFTFTFINWILEYQFPFINLFRRFLYFQIRNISSQIKCYINFVQSDDK